MSELDDTRTDYEQAVANKTLCECGCGEITPIATRTRSGKDRGFPKIKGEHLRFCNGHSMFGERHYRWQGGRSYVNQAKGYVRVHCPSHPRAVKNKVLEHIVIAEKALGHYLPLKAEVHHFNENKQDNRNSNLVICEDRAYHKLIHMRMRAIVAGYPASWRKCHICKQYDSPVLVFSTGRRGAFHTFCKTKYLRERLERIALQGDTNNGRA
jgi:hypothetical protein